MNIQTSALISNLKAAILFASKDGTRLALNSIDMTAEQAAKAEETIRGIGYDVRARRSPIGRIGWELTCEDIEGGRPLYAFSGKDALMLAYAGRVRKLT